MHAFYVFDFCRYNNEKGQKPTKTKVNDMKVLTEKVQLLVVVST